MEFFSVYGKGKFSHSKHYETSTEVEEKIPLIHHAARNQHGTELLCGGSESIVEGSELLSKAVLRRWEAEE